MKSDGYLYIFSNTFHGSICSWHNLSVCICNISYGFQPANLSYDRPSDEVSKLLANHAELIFLEVT